MYRILIADDEKSEREVIMYLIQKNNLPLEIFEAGNGKEALNLLEKEQIDILFTDIQMPFINGLELAAKAKELYPSLEILFFSGYDDFDYVKQALSLRAVNYILKPINPEEFQKSITEMLQSMKAKGNPYDQYTKYMEGAFHTATTTTPITASYPELDSDVEDSLLLTEIEQAIRLKNVVLLQQNTRYLLDKYQEAPNVSHIYVRYLCTSLLRFLLNCLPHTEESIFQKATMEIYSFRSFSEVKGYIENYLEQVLTHMNQEAQAPSHAIHIVEQYIHEHYMEDLSLNQLADIVYLSPKYLSDIFSQTTKKNLNKYIRSIRLEKASDLLLHSNRKVANISSKVGYPNVSYFCKLFQEEYGTSPEKYRLLRH